MKKILLGMGIILMIIWFFGISKNQTGFISPAFIQQKASTPAPTPNAPKTFKFDSTTDLKQELEKVNPQVSESDFE